MLLNRVMRVQRDLIQLWKSKEKHKPHHVTSTLLLVTFFKEKKKEFGSSFFKMKQSRFQLDWIHNAPRTL